MKTGKNFMEQTKYQNMIETDQQSGGAQPPLEKPHDNKGIINLPKPQTDKKYDVNLLDLINERTSVRAYTDEAVEQSELSYFLWCTQGVKSERRDKATFRTVPSAGARHALETYLLINNVQGLKKGVYRYIASKHAIVPINLDDGIGDCLLAACLGQGVVTSSAVTFFWAADINRMVYRYGQRGYRYIHLDAGHVCQNLYLAAESLGCGACAIAAFDDDDTNTALGLDGEKEFVVYVATLGKKNR